MSTRRDALRILGLSSVMLPASVAGEQAQEVGDQPGHLHTATVTPLAKPGKPTFLQPGEFTTIEALSECIIPRSDTPGAKDAGVTLLIDKAIAALPPLGPMFRAGIADLNALSSDSFGADFAALKPEQQTAVLTPLSLDNSSSLGKFFATVKDMTVDAYYKTKAGLVTELGWHGNTYLAEFPGCDHPEHQG